MVDADRVSRARELLKQYDAELNPDFFRVRQEFQALAYDEALERGDITREVIAKYAVRESVQMRRAGLHSVLDALGILYWGEGDAEGLLFVTSGSSVMALSREELLRDVPVLSGLRVKVLSDQELVELVQKHGEEKERVKSKKSKSKSKKN